MHQPFEQREIPPFQRFSYRVEWFAWFEVFPPAAVSEVYRDFLRFKEEMYRRLNIPARLLISPPVILRSSRRHKGNGKLLEGSDG